MKKKYSNFHINLSSALKISKTYRLFTIVLIAFLSVNNCFAQTISSFSPSSACSNSGASVIITGTGFTGTTAVKFNGVIAAYSVNSDTQITATLPVGATNGTISITTPLGTASSAATFTVNNILVPSVSIVASPVSPICAGTSVTFTATSVNGGSTPTYQWHVAGIAVGTNSPTFTTSTLGNGNQVKVEMTSNATCPVPATVTSNVLTMTVNPLLTPSVTIVATKTVFCTGTSVTFSVDVLTNGGLDPTYQWRLNGTAVGTNINTFTSSTLSDNDVLILDIISSATCATPAMVSSNSIMVTVNPDAVINLTSGAGTNNQTLCANTLISNITFGISGGATGASIIGLPGGLSGNFSGGVFTISGTPTVSGSFPYIITTTGTCAQSTSTGTITVNPNSTINLTSGAGSNNQTRCINAAISNITFGVSGGGTGAGVTGLPAGITGNFSGGVFTISGTPTVAGTYNYMVTTTGTCSQTSAAGIITVNPKLPTSVSIVSTDADNTICAGTIVTFTATPTNGGTTPNYQWYAGATPVGSNSATYTTSGLTTGQSVSVVITSNAVCATGSPATSNAIVTTVNPNLSVSVSIGATATTICAGTSVTLTATPTNGGTTPAYQWQVNGVNTGTNSNLFTTSSLTNGQVVTVILTSSATACANGNPATSTGITMTVNPNLPVSVSAAASATTICPGTSVTFTATPTNAGTTPSYQWQVNGANAGTGTNIFTTSGLTNGQVVTVILTSSVTPCATGNPATSTGITITVNPNLPVSVSAAASATTICPGTSVTFTATPTNGGTTPSYQWKVNGVNAGINSNTFTTTTLTNGEIVIVVLTSNATCPTSNPATSTGITMTVNPNLSVSVSIAATATTICAGTSVTFTATPTNGGATPMYQWKVSGVIAGTNSNTFTTTTLTTGQVVTVVLTSNATPCATGNPATSNSITMTVNPLVTPSVSIAASATTICLGTSVTFTATPANGGVTPTYQWKVNGGSVGTNNPTYTTSGLTNGQIVTVVITSNAICPTPTTATSNAVTMVVYTGIPAFSGGSPGRITGNNSVCPVSSQTYTAGSLSSGIATSYTWSFPTGFSIVSQTGNQVTVDVTAAAAIANNQPITVIASNPCGSSTVSQTFIVSVNKFAGVTVGSNQSVCVGGSTVVVATLTGNATTATWTAPSGSFSNIINTSTNVTATYTPSISNGNVTLTVTTNLPSGNCTPAVAGTAQLIITVNQPSIAPISVSTSASPICNGSSITLTQTGGSLGTGANWKWYSDAGFSVLIGTSVSANASLTLNPAATTTYYLRAESSTGAPCTANVAAAGNVTVTVNQSSVAPTSVNASASTICNGSSITLTQTGGTLGTGASWKWYSDATFSTTVGTSAAANASLTLSPTATTTYYLRAESSTGAPCTANVAAAGNVTVTVNQPSVAPTSVNTSTSPICNGSSITLTQTGGSLGTGASWKWYSDAGFTTSVGNSAATNASLTLNPTTTTTYYLRAESSTGAPCTANVSAAGSVIVTVNLSSVAPNSLTGSPNTICNGSSTTLTQTGGTLGTGANWKWYSDAGFIIPVGTSLSANASLSVSPTATTTYYLRAESSTGAPCIANVAAPGNVTITINQPSVAPTSVNISASPICNGSSITLTQTGGSLGTGASWKWYSDAGFTTSVGNSAAANASLTLNPTTTTTYYLRAESSTGAPCAANVSATGSVTIIVNQSSVAPTSLIGLPNTICNGSSTTLTQTGGTLGTGASWKWYSDAGFTIPVGTSLSANASLSVSPTATTTYYLRAESSTGAPCAANVAAPGNLTITVNQPSVAPTSINTSASPICTGSSITLTQTGGSLGTGASWKWYSDASFITLVGTSAAANASLTLTPAATTTYYLRAENSTGVPCTANIAAAGSILVTLSQSSVAPTSINGLPNTICNGNTATLTQTGGSLGTGATWKWYLDAGFTALVGTSAAANASLSVIPSATTTYYLRAESITSAPCTANVAASGSITITVNDAVVINSQPVATQTLCSGDNVTFGVTATGTGLTYQWRKGTTTLVNSGTISGATSSVLTILNLATTDAANNYNVVITGTSPCVSASSNNSILLINRKVTIGTQPSNVGICASNPAKFGIVASGDGLTYQWYKGTFPGTAVTNTAFITGAQTSILNFSQAFLADDGVYYVVVSGASPCSSLKSNEVTLNVDQSILITSQPVAQTVCEGAPNISFSVTANAGGDPITYQWRKNSVNILSATSATYTIATTVLANAGNYDVVVSGPSGYTCTSIQSAAAILTINPKPIGSATTQTICSGSSINVALNSTVSGTTFSWIAAIQTNPTGGTISGFSDSSGNIIAQSLTNTGTSAGTIRYTITPTANSCIGITFTVDVTVNPAPVGSTIAQTICSGSTTNVVLNSTVTGTTYSWTAAIQTSPTAGTITGFSNGTQNTIVQTLNNTGTTAGIIRYTITPTSNSCSGEAFTVDVTVNPNSTIVLSSVSGSDNPTNCVNTVLNISYAIGGGGTNASITAGALPAGVIGSYDSGTRVYTISGTPSAIGTFSYTATTLGLCSNASVSGFITVNPDSTISLNLGTGSDNQTKCINSAITPIKYTISNGGTNPSIAWNPGPANFIGSYDSAAGVYTISGSSAVAGTFNYTISTASSCINSSLTGQITVNPNPVGSAVSQIICSGSVSNVVLNPSTGGTTFAWTAASQTTPTGGSISGFGSGSGASIPQTLTNTGTTSGSIRYTVTPTANSCPGSPFTVDVTVNPKPNGSAIAQTVCSGVKTNVPLNSTISGTTFIWTSAIISMPSGGTISGFNTGTTNTIAETLSNSGTTDGVIRYTVTPTANNCSGAVFTVDVTVNAPTVGGTTTISSTTNPSNVDNGTTKLTDCHSSGGVIRLNGNVGTIVGWETSTNAGGTWIPRGKAGSLTYNYTGITAATIFRAVIQNSSCTIVNSGISTLFIIPNIKPSPVSAIPSTICEGESTQLSSDSGFSSSQNLASGGLFNQANPTGWLVDDKIFPASGDNGINNEFSETNGNAGDEYDSGDGKFAITRGNRTSVMQTPVFDLIGLTSANLTFDHAYKLDAVNDYAEVKFSLDGGLTYPVTLATFNGNTSIKNPFKNSNPANSISLNLNAYLGYSNIKIGFFFYGTVNAAGTKVPNVGSTWAIDNVKIPQAPDPLLTSQWKNLNNNAIISVTNTTRVTVTPPVTTTYEVTSFLNGCTSYGTEGTTYVTVTVNKRPTANIGPDQTICYDGTGTFSVALTGVAPWTVTYTNGVTSTTVNNINTNPFLFSVPNIKTDVTYTITALNDKNCTSFPGGITGSAKVTVLLGRPGWWTGLVSTDWFDCKNWEQGLPSFIVDANILPIVANGNRLPVIDKTSAFAILYGGIASAKDMIITTAGSVTMVSTNNSELQISGNWRNSGAFIPGTGTVTFNGATANQIQTINAGIKTNETFYNLTTNNSGTAKGISVVDGFKLTVLNNLTLTTGDLRLTGEAQLVQAGTAANPSTGTGKLLRDQQGQKNSFNYNYWSSPVSSNGLDYSIGSVLRDGTSMTNTYTDISNFNPSTPSPTTTISFIDGAFSADAPSSPITISNRWLWTFNSPALSDPLLNYYQWKYIGSTGSIKVGEGFTMKGTGGIAPLSATQNYVFVGKPNSGNISLNLTKDQTYLIGNPYPSALDADEFIKDNIKETINGKVGRNTENVFNGALYFWDHFGLSNNHYLAEYQGGYATYTLIGGTAAVADSPLTAGGTGSKIPERYIPVGQGFFVDAFVDDGLAGGITSLICPTGCSVIFKNSQRAFVSETPGNSLFMKTNATTKSNTAEIDTISKIRLGFDSPLGAHRQLLVGADANTTNQFDIGYDGLMFDTSENDMFWEISNSQFVIQGVPNFDDNQILPLGITIANEGLSTIKIDALENMPNTTKIYLHDNLTDIYHELMENAFKISLAVGEYTNRFSLRFTDKTLKVNDFTLPENIFIYFTNNTKSLNIKNNFTNGTVNKVFLFNLLGQSIANWDVEEQKQNNIQIPIKNVPAGVYIVKVKTTKGIFSKKIVIR
ncbi:PKD-like domain-containing protein [Flavobacterium sp. LB3P45]|uniref:PKD-like domain-containing protein n=1 Tax=Flavobacterium fructosi TaxID=3230416 RepID=A0ABW6HIF9_9FLAO